VKVPITWIRGVDCAIAIDMRAHPVVITTWFGTATVDLIDRYYQWFDTLVAASLAAEQRLVRISDLGPARFPPGNVRKRSYEHIRGDLATDVTLVNYVVVENPLIRGVVASIRWIGGGRREPDFQLVDTVPHALERAIERLKIARIPRPEGLEPDSYEPPRFDPTLV
jgi:hypothetical protein